MRYPVLGRSQVVDSKRRDVRVVEGARLESVCRGNSTVGSNPTLSANSPAQAHRVLSGLHGLPRSVRVVDIHRGRLRRGATRGVGLRVSRSSIRRGRHAVRAFGFSWADQQRTAEWLTPHPGAGILVHQFTPRLRAIYRALGYQLRLLDAPRRINCTGDRTPAREVLAVRNL